MYLYPKWIRFWHLLNALLCLLLIFTGLNLQYSWGVIPLEKAAGVHIIGGIILSGSYLIFFVGNLVSPNRKHYKIRCKGLFASMFKQLQYYLIGIFRGEKNPFRISKENKFNPLQKVSYLFIMYFCIPLIIITGWDMMFPGTLSIRLIGTRGLVVSDLIHVISGFLVSIFMIIHIYFSTLGPTTGSLFMSILSGYYAGDD